LTAGRNGVCDAENSAAPAVSAAQSGNSSVISLFVVLHGSAAVGRRVLIRLNFELLTRRFPPDPALNLHSLLRTDDGCAAMPENAMGRLAED